jgi:hypothetical protein
MTLSQKRGWRVAIHDKAEASVPYLMQRELD